MSKGRSAKRPSKEKEALLDDGALWASIQLASASPKDRSPRVTTSVRPVPLPSFEAVSSIRLYEDDVALCSRASPVATKQETKKPLRNAVSMSSTTLASAMKTESSGKAVPRARSLQEIRTEKPTVMNSGDEAMDHRLFVPRDQWIQHNHRKACVVCDRDFNVLRKKHSCRMCGDVVCSRCSVFKSVKLPIGLSKARVCSRCFLAYRNGAVQVKCDDESDDKSKTTPVEELETKAINISPRPTPSPLSDRPAQPVSLLTPDDLAAVSRTREAAAPVHTAPSIMLLSPTKSAELIFEMRLEELKKSYTSTMSTDLLSSPSISSWSSASSVVSSASLNEEELAAAMKARELEKEVESSRQRIGELELRMQEQENQKAELSQEQQNQLTEAREMIAMLQAQLRQQEQSARDAAAVRDSMYMSHMRPPLAPTAPTGADRSSARSRRSGSVEEESATLKQKLRMLERQLQQAGINVAEVIPYAVATKRIAEIARRMAEITDAETTQHLDGAALVALRREYYVLEQDMERFHTALLMSDEYQEQQKQQEQEWEDQHQEANTEALRTVRTAMPVNIAQLSEQALRTLETPSGQRGIPSELARRFKRTNVLQLLRVAPEAIVRMHPSVIENYRTTGLSLLERRALHCALRQAAVEWKKQEREEQSQKKALWFKKLKDGLTQAIRTYEQHYEQAHATGATCKLLGKACPVRQEAAIAALYATELGFPSDAVYLTQDIVKSDPEGAGEKALQEAQAHARAALANQRHMMLKAHYGMNVREVAVAMGALEDMESLLERIRALDHHAFEAFSPLDENSEGIAERAEKERVWERLLMEVRELTQLMARRSGICLTGKRDPTKDAVDSRSPLEICVANGVALYMLSMFEDLEGVVGQQSKSNGSLGRLREMLGEIQSKNKAIESSSTIEGDAGSKPSQDGGVATDRVRWTDRVRTKPSENETTTASATTIEAVAVAPLPRGAMLLDAIRAKRKEKDVEQSPASTVKSTSSSKSTDLLAAIRAKRLATSTSQNEAEQKPLPAKKPSASSSPGDLLAAIRARKKRAASDASVQSETAVTA
ncbi:hypothetical protein Poli38472_003601 [Pythium oligandrum]|uniref:FYVE-type domain-containing protein n=1 Tax=Pythium oligandrum TaxID=41045 RepID=A0A8K1FKA4_PYTOL|nr:hypothetical protein Poli38472_003601 [Pythium oligandrum]|eukprot:TMW65836.1 hypothetical protein Poli38472_003601 [Pythium oligandrum]